MSYVSKCAFGLILAALLFIVDTALAEDPATNTATEMMTQWCVNRMSTWAPPGRSKYVAATEEPEIGLRRYAEIARDAMFVAYDPKEQPLFKGPLGRAMTLALMLAVAESESAFRRDVDFGEGKYARGDAGKSWCLMQVNLGVPDQSGRTRTRVELTKDYWHISSHTDDYGGEDLVRDRVLCFRVALHIMRNSFSACRTSPVRDRLSIYASGKSCDTGKNASAFRVNKAMRWLAMSAPPVSDSILLKELYPVENDHPATTSEKVSSH
jgi:hypothetical protein